MDTSIVSHQPLNPQHISSLIQMIQSHHFEEGVYLVKRKSVYFDKDHYGFAVVGKFLKYFDSSWDRPKVIHKTNLGVHADPFEPFSWERIEKMSESDIRLAVLRTKISMNDAYDLLLDNCEHFARFVITGIKESSQIQNAVKLGIAGVTAYFLLKDDN